MADVDSLRNYASDVLTSGWRLLCTERSTRDSIRTESGAMNFGWTGAKKRSRYGSLRSEGDAAPARAAHNISTCDRTAECAEATRSDSSVTRNTARPICEVSQVSQGELIDSLIADQDQSSETANKEATRAGRAPVRVQQACAVRHRLDVQAPSPGDRQLAT